MKNMKKKKGCVRGDGVRADAGLAIPGARRMARPVRSHRYRRGDARLGDVRTCRERITKAGLLSHLATFWLIISLQVQGPAVWPRPLKHAAGTRARAGCCAAFRAAQHRARRAPFS